MKVRFASARLLAVCSLVLMTATMLWSGASSAGAAKAKGTTIVIGTMEDETGTGSAGTITVGTDTMNAWVKWTNAHGGIAGHPVKLYSENDNDDPAQAQSDLNTLVNQDHIVALVGQDAEGTEPTWDAYMQKAGVPVIGGSGYSLAWTTDSMFYPVTTTVLSNVWAGEFVAKHANLTKQALLQCNTSTVCLGALPLIELGAKQLGVDLVYNETASTTATDYTAQCLAMKSSGAQIVEATVNNQLLARNCAAQGYHPVWEFANEDVTYSQMAATPQWNGGLGFSNAFPFWQSYPQTASYFSAMKKYASQYLPGGSKHNELGVASTAAWASGVVFANAVKNAAVPAGSTVTTADVINGLSMIQNSTNGGVTPPVSYGNGTTPSKPVPCFWLTKIKNAQWVAPNGLKTFCEPAADLG